MRTIAETQINYLRIISSVNKWPRHLKTLATEMYTHSDNTTAYVFFDKSAILINTLNKSWFTHDYN